jgi:TolB-like protein
VQWGIAYVAGAWGLLQGIGFAADAFAWPSAIKQVGLLLLLIGLPVVLVIAWYHGDRGEQQVTRVELAILTLLFLLGGGLFWRYDRANEESLARSSLTAPTSTPMTADAARAMASTNAMLMDRPSLAVLPFDSLGGDSQDSYFADGMTDDIITDLSKLSGILIIARNSSWTYKGKSVKVQQVAKDLGVRYVLEGSVRRAGDTVRINAQHRRCARWPASLGRALRWIYAGRFRAAGQGHRANRRRACGKPHA